MKYIVQVREVHISHREVEANSPEEAKELVSNGDDTEVYLEYSHTLGSDTWTVEKKN